MIQNNLFSRMNNGETVYGIFSNCTSVVNVEIASLSGFDFIVIDGEHSPVNDIMTRELIAAAEYRGSVPIVRVPNQLSSSILRTLDIGAHGILVPQVNSVKEAQNIVNATYYAPKGKRGVANSRASDYGFVDNYFEKANERNMLAVQCENIKAVQYLDEIAAIDGIDMIFVGPYDLSQSMQSMGKVAYSDIKETVDAVLKAVKKHNKLAGIYVKNADEARFYQELGFRFIIVNTDMGLLSAACRNLKDELANNL